MCPRGRGRDVESECAKNSTFGWSARAGEMANSQFLLSSDCEFEPFALVFKQGLTGQGGVAGDFDVALSLQLAEGKEWVFDLIRPMLLADKKPFPPPMPDLFLSQGRSAREGLTTGSGRADD